MLIFSFLPTRAPAKFALVSKRFHAISKLPYAKSLWLIERFGRTYALYHAIRIGAIIDGPTLDSLLDGGRAHVSRYWFQVFISAYFKKHPKGISRKFAMADKLPFTAYAAIVAKAHAVYGAEMAMNNKKDDGIAFVIWSVL